MSHKLKIMSHQWIDDHELGTCGHPPEATYNLRFQLLVASSDFIFSFAPQNKCVLYSCW